jgi:hypothetical protein
MTTAVTHFRFRAGRGSRLGHADPGLTLRAYAHAIATMHGEATAAMDRVLGA